MAVSFFGAPDIASIAFFNNGSGISLGVKMVLPAGTISAGRWYFPDQPTVCTWKLYDSTPSTVLASASPDALTQQVYVTFTTTPTNLPLHVSAGTYWSVIDTDGPYSAIAGFYTSGVVTRNGMTFGASAFATPVGPPTSSSNAAYMNDIVFTPDSAHSVAGDFMPFFS